MSEATRQLAPSWSDPLAFERRAEGLVARRLGSDDDDEQPYHWVSVAEQAEFSPRYAHAALIDGHGSLFVIGGATSDGLDADHAYLNDIWRSDDGGRHWQRISNAKYPDRFRPRRGHAATMDQLGVVMFVLGGFCGKDCKSRYLNDWWSSNGGDIWHDMDLSSPARWSARHGHAAVMTHGDRLIMLGGHDGNNYLNDVWFIQDPAQAVDKWHVANRDAPWTPRYGHAVVVSSTDDLYLLGGFYANKRAGDVHCFNDVWVSNDQGATWKLVVRHAPWAGRYQHGAVVNSLDELVVVGGIDVELQRHHDTWRSKDGGRSWSLVNEALSWEPRYEHALVVDRNDSLYLIGGMTSGSHRLSDVWRSERTCADNVKCQGQGVICRDGTKDNFEGMPKPICVSVCDRRYFDECDRKEACRVKENKPVCIDPCDSFRCDSGNVCEVMPRGGYLPSDKAKQLESATAFCLSCGGSQTKFACDVLRQCTWSPGEEACLTMCEVLESKKACEDEVKRSGDSRCEWKDKACAEIPEEGE